MQLNRKGCKELLMGRMFSAIISSIAVQFFLVTCLLLLTNVNTDHSAWIQNTWTAITSFRMWSYFFVLATVTFFQGVICSKNYLTIPPYMKSRFAKLCGTFTSQNILLCALHILNGGLLISLHLSIKGGTHNFLTTECKLAYGICLMEERYFLFLSGFWSGLYFFLKNSIFHVKYLKFPIISCSKFSRFKSGMYSILPSLMAQCIWPTLYYLVGYYFLGSYSLSTILFLLSAQLENEPLNTVSRLLSLQLIFQLWLYQLEFLLTIESMYLLFELHLTEWVPFDFKQSNVLNNEESGVTLPEVLSMDQIPIMQHLGYLDLATIAQKDKARRSVLFTLSQPGGHPYNWNSIVEKSIGIITKFSEELSAACVKIPEPIPSCFPSSSTMTNVNAFRKENAYRMRSLIKEEMSLCTEQYELQKEDDEFILQNFLKTKWNNLQTYLLSKPLIAYIFGEIEDRKVCHVMLNGQSIIWASDAISSLAVLSLSEDFYGIVLKDQSLIINTLLLLKQALDKLQKSNVMTKKHEEDDRFVKQMFHSLRAVTKRSIYRIVINFEEYIEDLALERTTMEQLHSFLVYRE